MSFLKVDKFSKKRKIFIYIVAQDFNFTNIKLFVIVFFEAIIKILKIGDIFWPIDLANRRHDLQSTEDFLI